MNPKKVETWAWVLIYGGLLALSIGVFVLRGGGGALGWVLIGLGMVAAAAGAVLVVWRSRMLPPAPSPPAP